MAIPAAAIAKAAIGVLSNEKTRKAAGWVLVAILSPIILLIAAFCSILGGSADHNSSILDLCFYGGTLPADIPAEYRAYIEDMQASFALLDERIAEINSMTEDGESLDAIRVKAFFYALYFGAESPSSRAHQQFVDCFVTYEERTRPLDSTDSEDESTGEPEEETYTVAIPITDIATIWSNIQTALGETVTEEQRNNADSIYNLVRYGSATGTEGCPVPKCRLSVRMDFVLQWAPAGKVESHQSLDTDPIPLPARQKVIPVSTSLCPQAHQFVQLCPESLQRQPTMLVAMATM